MSEIAVTLIWLAAAGCWLWLNRAARSRGALMKKLALRYGAFVKRRFSMVTLNLESYEISFVEVIEGAPCKFRMRYRFPFSRGSLPCTLIEMELPSLVFGSEGGSYGTADLRAGRGLFLAGTNLTAAYRSFIALLPENADLCVDWFGAEVRLTVPALLGRSEEFWVSQCLEFLRGAAAAILAAKPHKGVSLLQDLPAKAGGSA